MAHERRRNDAGDGRHRAKSIPLLDRAAGITLNRHGGRRHTPRRQNADYSDPSSQREISAQKRIPLQPPTLPPAEADKPEITRSRVGTELSPLSSLGLPTQTRARDEDEGGAATGRSSVHPSSAMRLYRHALESIFGMLQLEDLAEILAVSRGCSAAALSCRGVASTSSAHPSPAATT